MKDVLDLDLDWSRLLRPPGLHFNYVYILIKIAGIVSGNRVPVDLY
jgi:hypothetical protein